MAKPSREQPPSAPERVLRVVDPDHSLVFAVFTPRELDEVRKLCRDAKNSGDSELAKPYLEAALDRANPIRPVDGMAR